MLNGDKLAHHVGYYHLEQLIEAFGEEVPITSPQSQKSTGSNLRYSAFNTPKNSTLKKVTIVEGSQDMRNQVVDSPEYDL